MNIKKGDIVAILTGKDRGEGGKPKTGKVLAVIPDKNRLIVEGINMISKHQRPTQRNPKGGVITKEAPIHRSNVAPYCKSCGRPTKVGIKVLEEESGNSKLRICRRCGEAL